MPTDLDGPFVLDLRFFTPDGPLDPADFSTTTTRADGTTTEGDGRISLRLCDYEIITVDATTPRSSTYAAKTDRAFFVVGGNERGVDATAPRPGWCGREPEPPEPGAVGVPGGLRVASAGSTYIEFAWDPVEGATAYEIQLSLTDQFTTPHMTAMVTTTMHRFSGLPTGTIGSARMRPHYGDWAASGWSGTATGTTTGTPPPSKRLHLVRMLLDDSIHLTGHHDYKHPTTISVSPPPDGFAEPFIVSIEYTTEDGLTADDFITTTLHADGTTTIGTGSLHLEMCVFDSVLVTATTGGDATYPPETTRTMFYLGPPRDGRIWDHTAPRCSGPGPHEPPPPPATEIRRHVVFVGTHTNKGTRTLQPEGGNRIAYSPQDLTQRLGGANLIPLTYSSPDAGPDGNDLHADDFTTTIRYGDGTTTRGDGFVTVRICDFQTVIVEATTEGDDLYPEATTRLEIIVGGDENGVDPTAKRPLWCPEEGKERRLVIRVNGQEIGQERKTEIFPNSYSIIHQGLTTEELPTDLDGPYVLTVEFSSPDGPLTGSDFTTEIRRGYLKDGAHPSPFATGTGSIRLELCDFESVTIDASTPRSGPYRWVETRLRMLVGNSTPFPNWCGPPRPPRPPRPPPPLGVPEPIVSALDTGFIEWSWDPVPSAHAYEFQVAATVDGLEYADLLSTTGTGHRIVVGPETTRYIRVRAVVSGPQRVSRWSRTVSGTSRPEPVVLGVPRPFVSTTRNNYIGWEWDAIRNATGYQGQLADSVDGFGSGTHFSASGASYGVGVSPNTTKYIRVRAVAHRTGGGAQFGEWSEAVSGTSEAALGLPEPKVSKRGRTFIEWTWDAVENATGYRVESGPTANARGDNWAHVSRHGRFFMKHHLEPGAKWYIRVRALGPGTPSRSLGEWSDAVSGTTDSTATPFSVSFTVPSGQQPLEGPSRERRHFNPSMTIEVSHPADITPLWDIFYGKAQLSAGKIKVRDIVLTNGPFLDDLSFGLITTRSPGAYLLRFERKGPAAGGAGSLISIGEDLYISCWERDWGEDDTRGPFCSVTSRTR